jgi:hypothetical protein
MFYPPFWACSHCSKRLTEPLHHEVNLYTLRDGAIAAYSTSYYCCCMSYIFSCAILNSSPNRWDCPPKNTWYYHNYSVCEDKHHKGYVHTNCGGLPNNIQFEEHAFIEHELCEFFTNSMLTEWYSPFLILWNLSS